MTSHSTSENDPGIDKFVRVYRDSSGEYRWARIAPRGNLPDLIVAEGGQGYGVKDPEGNLDDDASRHSAIEAAQRENPDTEVRVSRDDPEALDAVRPESDPIQ